MGAKENLGAFMQDDVERYCTVASLTGFAVISLKTRAKASHAFRCDCPSAQLTERCYHNCTHDFAAAVQATQITQACKAIAKSMAKYLLSVLQHY